MGLTVNMPKTKYFEVNKQPTNTEMLKLDSQEYERVKEFKYLRTIFTEENDITTEIKQLIIMADRTSYGIRKQLSSLNLKHHTKCVLYKTLVRQILPYGSECWPLSKKDGDML
jgi:hypothetical protein